MGVIGNMQLNYNDRLAAQPLEMANMKGANRWISIKGIQ